MLAVMSVLTGATYGLAGWRFGFDRMPPFLGFPSMARVIAAVIFVALVVYVATLVESRLKVKR